MWLLWTWVIPVWLFVNLLNLSVFLRPPITHVLKIAYSCPNAILKAPWSTKIIFPALHSILLFNTNSVVFAFLSSLMCSTELDSLIVYCHMQILLICVWQDVPVSAYPHYSISTAPLFHNDLLEDTG